MKFTWKYYVIALILWATLTVGTILNAGYDVGLIPMLIGAYLGDLLLVYIAFRIYKWYKLRDSVE